MDLGDLPNDLLVSIFSLLPIRDAARTSIVSQSWKFLWTSTPSLELDERDQMVKDIYRVHKSLMTHTTRNRNHAEYFQTLITNLRTAVSIVRPPFIDLVNQVIRSHHGSTIDTFRISFDLDEESGKSDIDNWISFALEKRVQKLELDLSPAETTPSLSRCHGSYTLTTHLLHLHRLDSIRILRLNHVEVSGEVVEHALNNCHFLERLCIEYSNSLDSLRVCGTSLRLEHLEISFCFGVQCIEVSAPNLKSFNYAGPKTQLLLKNVPCLVAASFGFDCASYIANNSCQFSSYLYPLETLAMDFYCYLDSERFREFPELNKLKQLKLSFNVSHARAIQLFCIFSLKKLPSLQKFAIEVRWRNEAFKVPSIFNQNEARCSHQSLELFEFIGFARDTFDKEIVVYLSNYAVTLKKIVIHPYKARFPSEAQSEEITAARRNFARELKTEVRPGIELVVL